MCVILRHPVGSTVKLDVVRHKKRMQLHAMLLAPRHLVPKINEGENVPSYAICGGCVFVPLTDAWTSETLERRRAVSAHEPGATSIGPGELHGFQR